MQALTGLWAQQFGTINWAAHGGFCSVNMASAGLYMLGQSFWEFGDPDWDHAKYFMLWGVAEDHASNPIKMGLAKLKKNGGKFVSVNPVRTGYQAIADEWVGVRPGTDAMFALAMARVMIENDQFDKSFLIRYTNAPQLVIKNSGNSNDGLLWRDKNDNPQAWDIKEEKFVDATRSDITPALFGEWKTPEGLTVTTAFTLVSQEYLSDEYSLENAEKITGVPASEIERFALEMAHVAFKETVELDIEWTDWAGRKHDKFIGHPVSMHAMRGISAHSNGFQTCRAIHMLQILLGAVDCPGAHLAKPPFPRMIPPPIKPAKEMAPNTPLKTPPLGFPTSPEDLAIDAEGNPLRIDKAYSWDAPIANHGLMHMVINNAVKGDPYTIDTLILFMANMAWNSSMNTSKVQDQLREKDDNGEYKIPFLVVADAFHSETVNFADLVLPDTTYLERFDTISILDRPISEPHIIADSIRQQIITPDRDVRPWQEVLVDLAGRLKFPAFTGEDGKPKFKDYKTFITQWEKHEGIGFLAGWRGKDGEKSVTGEPNPNQWEKYIENDCFFEQELPDNQKYYRFANKDYLDFAAETHLNFNNKPIVMEVYSETLQKFNLAGQGLYDGPCPTDEVSKKRLTSYFTPFPTFYKPLEVDMINEEEYPFSTTTQRPMFMYHSWDSQNAWLRQIMAQNRLFMNRKKAISMGISDDSWVWVESENGKIKVQVRLMEGVEENTIWTWNAIGKQSGAWGLKADANEATKGFLLNHLISELLPKKESQREMTNSDPVTGQAAWYDTRVKIYLATDGEEKSYPQFDTIKPIPNAKKQPSVLRYQTHKAVNLVRSMKDILTRGNKAR
ncbi:Anaerobic dimethyl sulfoxide reductase chain A [hydrothermal vent metagenome]|uniref:Anaerobic dimethyl sulfoxide reductase chain A n=1 Tax=hydrothermal vent metagenome TaxID=652676 RepID=A0A1W1BHM8_9ZZZZ